MRIKTGETFPADCILIRGAVLADEASLTGESTPARKFAVGSADADALLHGRDRQECIALVARLPQKAHFLYSGARAVSADNAEALVVRTGGSTYRGQLMREQR